MAQISYGTITITDTNDIERIYVVYAKHTSNTDSTGLPAVANWKELIAEAPGSGNYIWQRTVVKKSGITTLAYGDPVCVTGPQGIQGPRGPEGDAATNITDIQVQYGISANWNTQPSSWSNNSPDYDSTKPNYWTRTRLVYEDGTYSDWVINQDHTSTEAIANAVEANYNAAVANSIAQSANENAQGAMSQAAAAQQLATHVDTLLGGHFLWHGTALSQATPSGARVVERIQEGNTDVSSTPSKWLHNVNIGANGISLRYNEAVMAQLAANQSSSANTALKFYQPPTVSGNTTTQGNLAMELSGDALKFYDNTGSIIQASFGGNQATVNGTINAYTGKFGTSTNNYWTIDTFYDANQQENYSSLHSKGESFIQLEDTNTWTISTDKISSSWRYMSTNADGVTNPYYFRYKQFTSGGTYYDYGMHIPSVLNTQDQKAKRLSDKFLYIRYASYRTDDNLNQLELDSNWTYPFYVDSQGNVRATAFYTANSNTPIGGGAGTIAEKLTQGYGTEKRPVYIGADGVPATITVTDNTSATAVSNTDDNLITARTLYYAGYVKSSGVTSITLTQGTGITIDNSDIAITATGSRTIGLADNYGDTKNPYGSKTKNYVLASPATENGAPTFRALVATDIPDLSGTYLTSHQTVSNKAATLSWGSSKTIATIGSTNITVSLPSNPNTNTTYTFEDGTNGFTVTPSGGTAQTVTVTPSITNNVTGSGTSGYLAKFTGANTIGNGPALGSDTTKFLNNKGEWAVPAGTYTYTLPLATNGTRGGVQIGYTQSGKNYPVQLSSEKMYVNVPWENTWTVMTGATSSTDGAVGYIGATPPKSGYNTKYWRADGTWTVPPNDNTHRPVQLDGTQILGDNTTALNLVTGNAMSLTNSSGSVTISHADTSSQASITEASRTYIKSVTLDNYGHVTGLTTGTETVTNTHYNTHLYVGLSNSTSNAATTAAQDTYLRLFDNTTARESHKLTGGNGLSITSDSNGHITFTSPDAFTGVSAVNTGTEQNPIYVLRFTKSGGGSTDVSTANIAVIQSEGANKLVSSTETSGINVSGPVKFVNGVPVQMTTANNDSIAWGLISGAPNTYTPSSHTHGNLSNDGKITATATIASGDKLVIVDTDSTAGSKITGSSITFGTSTTTFLSNKGTWETPSAAGSATNATYATYDASEANNTTKVAIADKYIPKSIGTAAGDIIYWSASGTPTRLAKGSNGQVLKLASGVPTWGTDNNDNTWRKIQVNGTDILGTATSTNPLNLKAGNNVTITNSSGTVTIESSYTNTDTKVTQAYSTTNGSYPLLFSATAGVTSTDSRGDTTAILNNSIYANPSTGNLQVTQINGVTVGSSPKFTDNDTKNTAGSSDTSSKIFLIGATSQATNATTYSHDTAYVGTNGHLYSASKEVLVGGSNAESSVTITPSTTAVYSMTSTGSVTAGTAASFTRGTFTAGSLTMAPASTTATVTTLNITFTAPSHAADSFTANTPTAVTLPGRSSKINAWTGYTAATAAAQTFTGSTS